ncbi:hypothetical protein JTE90_003800 [Oedothorax gibbosus]|uniref:THAP-type domain-containing protein n=1 Tax=Oedothorax gibbosus TaxID=931172 RepID=A0AAV6V9K9_9ARAC|nr:hypothetical protein JTE90_003800 [Oedothorax gibbosus]
MLFNTDLQKTFSNCFPSEDRFPGRSDKWIAAVNHKNPDGTNWCPSTNSRICSEHFVGGKKRDEVLHPAYIPTIMPAVYHRRSAGAVQVESRFQRTRKKELGVELLQTDEPNCMKECSMENEVEISKKVTGKQSLEEKRRKCRERVARYRAKMSDEMKAAKREKDREYKQKLKDQGVIKGIKELSSNDQCNKKKQWRKYSSNYRKRNSQIKEMEAVTVQDNLGWKGEINRDPNHPDMVPNLISFCTATKNVDERRPLLIKKMIIAPRKFPEIAANPHIAAGIQETDCVDAQSSTSSNTETSDCFDSSLLEPEVVIKVEPIDNDEDPTQSSLSHEFILPCTDSYQSPSTPVIKEAFAVVATEPVEEAQQITSNYRTTKPAKRQTSDVVKQINTNGRTMKSILKKTAEKVVKQAENTSHQESAETSKTTSPKDPFDVYGEYIAAKLRNLDLKSCTYVQKAFADILFDAEMGKFK